MKVHPNSKASLSMTDREKRYEQIIGALMRERRAMTDREIMRYLGFSDPNAVRPRITELIAKKELREVGSKLDRSTMRTVRIVNLPDGGLF